MKKALPVGRAFGLREKCIAALPMKVGAIIVREAGGANDHGKENIAGAWQVKKIPHKGMTRERGTFFDGLSRGFWRFRLQTYAEGIKL